jgi:hypothetical protein
MMAACPATLTPVAVQYQDDVFLSDTDDGGLLMMEDIDQFAPAERFPIGQSNSNTDCRQLRQAAGASDQVALYLEEETEEENHSDIDSEAVKIIDDQPRRGPSADSDTNTAHFQPSQIEEKLQNHRLLGADINGAQQADAAPSRAPRRASIWNGMVACLTPVVGYFKKEKQPKPKQDEWEIDFADISELDFIGSGAQGAVFAGDYLGKKVAVKKVKDPKYCDEAYNLRKLNHPNIVKMM